MLDISVAMEQRKHVGFDSDVFVSLANRIINDLIKLDLVKNLKNAEISLVWVDDAEIRSLNKQYRGKDKATDVLSFSYLDDLATNPEENPTLGEIVISVDTLQSQAREQNHSDDQEAKVLFVHGLLHILGYDHETESDLVVMKEKEVDYLGDNSGLVSRVDA